jgi:DNA-directed RNA polymerase subunit RPC12/RpoP
MNQIVYKCLNHKCACEFKESNKDGLRCPKCDNPIMPFNLNPNRKELLEVPTYRELKTTPMVNKKSWEEFRDSGLLWWINMIIHTFGWSIVVEVEKDGSVTNVYPARVKYRGFTNEFNTEGYIKVSEYLNKESMELLKESRE